jgi:hypothetical protein
MMNEGKPYEKRLEEFVFDALGDMVPPNDLEVLPDRRDNQESLLPGLMGPKTKKEESNNA